MSQLKNVRPSAMRMMNGRNGELRIAERSCSVVMKSNYITKNRSERNTDATYYKRPPNLPMMPERIDHATQPPPVSLLDGR